MQFVVRLTFINLFLFFFCMVQSFYPKDRAAWRAWLQRYHDKEKMVYVIKCKKHTCIPSITHQESMDEAICFGWIDTTIKKLDDARYRRCFVRRNAKSRWSSATLKYARRLIKGGLMTPAGLEMYKQGLKKPVIDHGFSRNPEVPVELKQALDKHGPAAHFFSSLALSYRRVYIYAVLRAKRPETKQKWVDWVVQRCVLKKKPGL